MKKSNVIWSISLATAAGVAAIVGRLSGEKRECNFQVPTVFSHLYERKINLKDVPTILQLVEAYQNERVSYESIDKILSGNVQLESIDTRILKGYIEGKISEETMRKVLNGEISPRMADLSEEERETLKERGYLFK